MKITIYLLSAVVSYLVSGWNPAITFSRMFYKTDIRKCGSGNPGFTNFRRTFGDKLAWFVLLLDLSKAAVVVLSFALLFERYIGNYQLGAAFSGFFALLGHSFPVWYNFKGGKGFLVTLSTLFVLDWRCGIFATLIMIALLLTTKYMSVSTVVALFCSPIFLFLFNCNFASVCVFASNVVFVAIRHAENFKRLIDGKESKFLIKKP